MPRLIAALLVGFLLGVLACLAYVQALKENLKVRDHYIRLRLRAQGLQTVGQQDPSYSNGKDAARSAAS